MGITVNDFFENIYSVIFSPKAFFEREDITISIRLALVTVIFGYVLTMLHICPVMYVDLPWTMPPLIISFLGSGGNIMGPVCQLLGIILSALVYLPFVKIYEKQQAQLASE